ncbi:MAG: hypothetical protein MUC87_03420 [Bacteroidia bacterium]|jgi:hypothetical protein|nr:hypothetical protein [Bacteroidia bacterium]
MKTKLIILLILFLSKGIHLNSQVSSDLLKPVELNETGIISHLMLVKQTSEYRAALYINKWNSEIQNLNKLIDTLKKPAYKAASDSLKSLKKQLESSIDSISISYSRMQFAYDRIILQLDYIIQSRNRVLFVKRLNRNVRKNKNDGLFKIKGSHQMKLFLGNLNTCYKLYQSFNNLIDQRESAFNKSRSLMSDVLKPINLPDLLSTTEQLIGIYNTIDEINGRRVDDVSKLLQACRFKSVTELLAPKKEEEDDKE